MYSFNDFVVGAASTFVLAASASTDVLTTISPCPEAPSSLQPSPITVTSQHQAVSTCNPVTACIRGQCSTNYHLNTYAYVSTAIPCAWNGQSVSTCTVTSTDEPVKLLEKTSTLTTVIPAPTINPAWRWRKGSHRMPPTTKYETIVQQYYAPYEELGAMAIPGYEGSGLCDDCDMQEDGSRSQEVDVIECRYDGTQPHCVEYEETWVSRPAAAATSQTSAVCATQSSVSAAGTYTWTFHQVAPATQVAVPATTRTVTMWDDKTSSQVVPATTITATPSPWDVYVTRTCEGPTFFDFTITETKTITYTAAWNVEQQPTR